MALPPQRSTVCFEAKFLTVQLGGPQILHVALEPLILPLPPEWNMTLCLADVVLGWNLGIRTHQTVTLSTWPDHKPNHWKCTFKSKAGLAG